MTLHSNIVQIKGMNALCSVARSGAVILPPIPDIFSFSFWSTDFLTPLQPRVKPKPFKRSTPSVPVCVFWSVSLSVL